ncbi:hypothetical protein [Iodobacter fluviatilis]|uniref:hypothetical protein n=1 Tax=Iodobacter fluviatilis TaxID=537 RepID=UPI0014047C81|nr:hypothetical protein [Iodobacter fluviatilis]
MADIWLRQRGAFYGFMNAGGDQIQGMQKMSYLTRFRSIELNSSEKPTPPSKKQP